MTRGRANWTRAALIAVGLFTAACGGDVVPQPAVTGPVKGAPMVQIPVESANAAPETTTPAAADSVPVATDPVDDGQATADATDAGPSETPATTVDSEPTADDADTGVDPTADVSPFDVEIEDGRDADESADAAADAGVIGDVDEPHVPDPVPPEDKTADNTSDKAPDDTAAAEPEPAKVDDKPWPKTKKGEALLVTFDDLASFVWIDPGAVAGTADIEGLGPPDPSADATAAKPDTAVPAPGPDHVGPSGERTSEIPKKIKELGGRTISLEGYMIPLEFDEDGAVRKFLLSRYMQGCCFGMLPQANELVLVEMTNPEGTAYEPYLTVLATGKFTVHEKGTALGALKTLYEVQATNCKFVIDR